MLQPLNSKSLQSIDKLFAVGAAIFALGMAAPSAAHAHGANISIDSLNFGDGDLLDQLITEALNEAVRSTLPQDPTPSDARLFSRRT